MATLEQIQIKLAKLQSQTDRLIAKEAQAALDEIRKLMSTYGLTTADIEARSSTKRGKGSVVGKSTSKASAAGKAAKQPKYLDPKSGAIWLGIGRTPAWIASVRDRSKFLLEKVGESGAQSSSVAKVARKASGKHTSTGSNPRVLNQRYTKTRSRVQPGASAAGPRHGLRPPKIGQNI